MRRRDHGRVRRDGEFDHEPRLAYSQKASERLWTAFRELFTPDMTVVVKLTDGSERRRDVLSKVDGEGWRSEAFVMEFDRAGGLVSLKVVNDRGEMVAGAAYSPPFTFGGRVDGFDPPSPPYHVGFDSLRLEFGVDLQGGPHEKRHAVAA